ncbi:hypothetical protein ABBQ38_011457 [Trebouxia sp. C0009 RCD-2024]
MAFQVNLTNEEAWSKEIAGSQSGVVQVVEVYQDWCGPCKAVVTTLKKQFFELGERPLKFYTANCKHISALDKFSGHCEPVFVFYQDGKLIATVSGVNAPVLCSSIDKLSAEAASAVAAKA